MQGIEVLSHAAARAQHAHGDLLGVLGLGFGNWGTSPAVLLELLRAKLCGRRNSVNGRAEANNMIEHLEKQYPHLALPLPPQEALIAAL
jgi:hypothetical protein